MENPDYVILKGSCPKCGDRIVSYLDGSLNDRSIMLWFIACDDSDCDYAYAEQFATLGALAIKFEAED